MYFGRLLTVTTRILSDWLREYDRARASNPALDLRTWASKVP